MLHYILAQVSIHVFQKAKQPAAFFFTAFFRAFVSVANQRFVFCSGGSGVFSPTGLFFYLDMWHLSVSAWFSCTHHRHSARQLGVNMTNSPVEMATSGFYPYFLHSGMSSYIPVVIFSHVLIGARPATWWFAHSPCSPTRTTSASRDLAVQERFPDFRRY